jgi:hypothetical protein
MAYRRSQSKKSLSREAAAIQHLFLPKNTNTGRVYRKPGRKLNIEWARRAFENAEAVIQRNILALIPYRTKQLVAGATGINYFVLIFWLKITFLVLTSTHFLIICPLSCPKY